MTIEELVEKIQDTHRSYAGECLGISDGELLPLLKEFAEGVRAEALKQAMAAIRARSDTLMDNTAFTIGPAADERWLKIYELHATERDVRDLLLSPTKEER